MPISKKPRHKQNPAKGMTNLRGQKKSYKKGSKTIKINRWLNFKHEAFTVKSSLLMKLIVLSIFVFLSKKIGGLDIPDILLFLEFTLRK